MHIAAIIGISSYDSLKNFRYFKRAFLKNSLRNFFIPDNNKGGH